MAHTTLHFCFAPRRPHESSIAQFRIAGRAPDATASTPCGGMAGSVNGPAFYKLASGQYLSPKRSSRAPMRPGQTSAGWRGRREHAVSTDATVPWNAPCFAIRVAQHSVEVRGISITEKTRWLGLSVLAGQVGRPAALTGILGGFDERMEDLLQQRLDGLVEDQRILRSMTVGLHCRRGAFFSSWVSSFFAECSEAQGLFPPHLTVTKPEAS